MATITVKNVDRCLKRLDNVGTIDVTKGVKDATKFVHAQAKALTPVDTGNLSGSIHMEVKTVNNTVEGRVYTNVQYAPYVEFGTGVTGNGSYPYELDNIKLAYKDDWVGMPAQPYMYPALKSAENYVKATINGTIQDKIKKACK